MLISSVKHDGKIFVSTSDAELKAAGVPLGVVVDAAQAQLGRKIDTAAGNARAAFVSPGSYIDQEYLLAKQEASEWLASGKDEAAIPSSVQDHIDMFGVSAEAAAQEIVATAEAWETALRDIRNLRLGGKAAVQRADTIEAKEEAAQQAIEQLNRYRPPEV
ncbi:MULTISPECIES: hypothetical protein [unclassified Halomonas]|uniref:hypothetical protein n=1 Tax=unclassified Halomonas TaxID=2609666 RepID=UPI0007D958BF|nr:MULTISPECIES: hypothetical protein [unclassified Halomonas]MBT2784806.1 hypothetical protein [Halomonas sp. ISL-106]MBT2796500.1 hypothetical protein [Halomonas sp. ISL-104]OAL59746.1 hypothetical protein A6R74_00260 [Halomonas sp. ALS9]